MVTEEVEASVGDRTITTTASVVSAATATVPTRTQAEHLEVSLEMMQESRLADASCASCGDFLSRVDTHSKS